MAVDRQIPTCPFCKAGVAVPIYRPQDPRNPFIGDNFDGWQYLPHDCEAAKTWREELVKNLPPFNNDLKNEDL